MNNVSYYNNISCSENDCALYLRLSKEDLDKLDSGDSSASIKNQKLLLTDYAIEHGFRITNVYSDDDFSGLYDNRPGFEQLIEDAKLGKFKIIIAKSQSRFTRNMEHMEHYLHNVFPLIGIRFIGVVDNIDTNVKGNKKARQINGLINEWYCEDLSENIKSTFKAKMRDGQFIGSSCQYGYIKDPKNHNHLIIDEYAANVVRRIYNLFLQGYGKSKIAKILSEDGVLTPSQYKREVLEQKYHNPNEKANSLWSYQTVLSILKSRVYIGDIVQNKAETISYKSKTKRHLPEEQWIIVENMHEPIIDKDTWNKVQELLKIKTSVVNPEGKVGLFAGKFYCKECQKAMQRYYPATKGGKRVFSHYICNTFKKMGKNFCSMHKINKDELEDIVLKQIQIEARKILTQDDLNELDNVKVLQSHNDNIQIQIQQLNKQVEEQERYKRKTYENYMDEIISKDDYKRYSAEYQDNIDNLKEKIGRLEKSQETNESIKHDYDEWVRNFKDYINIKHLDREVITHLIKKIEIDKDGNIYIQFMFSNPYENE